MKKWYSEEYEWEIEVIGFLRGDKTEGYCRNGEEIGDKYTCTYGCPVNADGQGICSKTMTLIYPIMESVRSGGDLTKVGGNSKFSKDFAISNLLFFAIFLFYHILLRLSRTKNYEN
jgi:uncharacterized repeat protein (TIGR04076 family)